MQKYITWILTDKCNLNCKHCFAVKTNTQSSIETIKNTISFIKNLPQDDVYNIRLWGGEIFTVQTNILNYIVDSLRDINNIRLYAQSNLIKMDADILSIIKKLHWIDTSYDYKVRFDKSEQERIWLKNINFLINSGVKINCVVSLTSDVIENIKPKEIFDFFNSLGIKSVELERMLIPLRQIDGFYSLVPDTNKLEDWLFEAYLIYEKEKLNGFYIETFNCIEESIKGNFYYEHGRCCNETNLTIDPLGNISSCYMLRNESIGNVKDGLNKTLWSRQIDKEKIIKTACKDCDLLDFCKGDCQFMVWKNGICSTPKKIYRYLLEKS